MAVYGCLFAWPRRKLARHITLPLAVQHGTEKMLLSQRSLQEEGAKGSNQHLQQGAVQEVMEEYLLHLLLLTAGASHQCHQV